MEHFKDACIEKACCHTILAWSHDSLWIPVFPAGALHKYSVRYNMIQQTRYARIDPHLALCHVSTGVSLTQCDLINPVPASMFMLFTCSLEF